MLTASVDTEKIARFETAKRKGVEYLLSHLKPNGELGEVKDGFYFYRAPWTFTVAGETRAATSVASWVRQNMWTPEGDFDNGLRVNRDAYAYRNATFIYGAHMARQFDLSHRSMEHLLSWQDPATGGFSNNLEDDGMSDDMDIPYTVGPGLACIATGYLDEARRVYDYLVRVYEQQDELPDRFYYNLSRKTGRVIREYPEDDRFWYVVESQEARPQRWTIGGIATAFLCRLYLADPKDEYIELARKYMQFSMDSTPRQFEFPQVCKSGWGSSLIYQVTGEDRYRDWTYKLGDWFADTQSDDGAWRRFEREGSESGQIHLVLEFVVHLDTIIGGLSAGLAR